MYVLGKMGFSFLIASALFIANLSCGNDQGRGRRDDSSNGFCADYSGAAAYNEIGSGTVGDPFMICTNAQFNDIAANNH